MRPSTLSLPTGMSKLLPQTSRSRLPVLTIGLGVVAGAATVLLRRMRADIRRGGRLRPSTAAAMYAGYAAHAVATAAALTRADLNLPNRTARSVGTPLAATGAMLCLAGLRRFASPGQVSGTADGPLVTSGVYRISRNPQYAGYLLLLAGMATVRRSSAALAFAGMLGVVYREWIRTEEHHLHRRFGADYDRYRRGTPRWLDLNPMRWSRTAELPEPGPTRREQPGFDFTETIRIDAPAPTVWATLVDIETWWLPSNPEHDSIERLDAGHEITVGTRFRIREKIAGVPGTGLGAITHLDPGTSVTWESDQMRYRLLAAVPFTISEGVTWRVDSDGPDHCCVSAHVWARFPTGPGGRLLWLLFTRLLNGINKDRRHARTELEYLSAILGRY